MKQHIYKIVSTVMAFVVLLSTMSFTFNLHFCGDTLVDTALFVKSDTCCAMEMAVQIKTSSDNCIITKKKCCSNKKAVLKGQNQLKQPFNKLSFQQQAFIISFPYSYRNLFKALHNKVIPFKHYVPPNVLKDIQLLDETFLI